MAEGESYLIAALNHECSSSSIEGDYTAAAKRFGDAWSNTTIEECLIKTNSTSKGGASIVVSNPSCDNNNNSRNREIGYKMTVGDRKMIYVGRKVKSPGSSNANFLKNRSDLHAAESADCSGSEWAILIKNKHTGKMSVRPAIFVQFNPDIEIPEDDEVSAIDKEAAKEMRNKLTLQYGSKKKKRALESKLNNSVNSESLDNMINSAVAQVKSDSTKDENANGGENGTSLNKILADAAKVTPSRGRNPKSSVLPAFNPNATAPGEIFDLNDIVSTEESVLLNEDAQKFAQMSWEDRKNAGFNEYTCELALNLPRHPEARQLRSIYLLYFDYLVKLCEIACKNRFFRQSMLETVTLNAEISRRLLEKYTEKQGSNKPKAFASFRLLAAGKDRLLSHVIILNLTFNEFSFGLSKLSKLFPEVNDSKFVTVANLLGCHVKKLKNTGERLITLSKPPEQKPSFLLGSSSSAKKRRF